MKWLYGSGAVVLLLLIVFVVFRPSVGDEPDEELPLSTVISDARTGVISRIDVHRNELEVTRNDGTRYRSQKEDGTSIVASSRMLAPISLA
jgi:hypothetical protein